MLMDEEATQAAIAAYLYGIATKHMGLSATDKRRCDYAAGLLVAMRPEFEAHRCEVTPGLADDDDGIIIGDGRSYVRLKLVERAGVARQPTHVEARISGFAGSFEYQPDDWVYPLFLRELKTLSNRLDGAAHMGNPHDDLYMVFSGDGHGHLRVHVEIRHPEFAAKTKFELQIDQSHLPELIDCLEVKFGVEVSE